MRSYRFQGSDFAMYFPEGIIWTVSLGESNPIFEELHHQQQLKMTRAQIEPIMAEIEGKNPDELIEKYKIVVEAGWRSNYYYEIFEKKDKALFLSNIAEIMAPELSEKQTSEENKNKDWIEIISKEIIEVSKRFGSGYAYKDAKYGKREVKDLVQPYVVLSILSTDRPLEALEKLKEMPVIEYKNFNELFLMMIDFLEKNSFKDLIYPEVHVATKCSLLALSKLPIVNYTLKKRIISTVLHMLCPNFFIYIIFDLYSRWHYIYVSNIRSVESDILTTEKDGKCNLSGLYLQFLERIKSIKEEYEKDALTVKWIDSFVESCSQAVFDFLIDITELLITEQECDKCKTLSSELKRILGENPELIKNIRTNMEDVCKDYSKWLVKLSKHIAKAKLRKLNEKIGSNRNDGLYKRYPIPSLIDFRPFTTQKILIASSSQDEKTLSNLSNDRNWKVREVVAKNLNTPKEILIKLSEDSSVKVKAAVAGNPNTPPQILLKFVKHFFEPIRIGLASNPHSPPEVLCKLAGDHSDGVRKRVASNRKTPPEVLEKLLEDEDWRVRRAAATNLNTPPNNFKPEEDGGFNIWRYILQLSQSKDSEKSEKLSQKFKEMIQEHPEDWRIHQSFLEFALGDKSASKEAISLAIDSAEEWMSKHGSHPLFRIYIQLRRKVARAIPFELNKIERLGDEFLNLCTYQDKDIKAIIDFAALIRKVNPSKFEQIYEILFKADVNDNTMSSIYYNYAREHLEEALNSRTSASERLKKLKKVEYALGESLRYNPRNYISRAFLGVCLKEMGNSSDFMNELKKAQKLARLLKKSPGEIPYKIGEFYLELRGDEEVLGKEEEAFKMNEEAIKWFEWASKLDQKNPVNHWKLSNCLLKKSISLKKKGDYERAFYILRNGYKSLKIVLEAQSRGELNRPPASEEIKKLKEDYEKELQELSHKKED